MKKKGAKNSVTFLIVNRIYILTTTTNGNKNFAGGGSMQPGQEAFINGSDVLVQLLLISILIIIVPLVFIIVLFVKNRNKRLQKIEDKVDRLLLEKKKMNN